jgi:hypothetical protein
MPTQMLQLASKKWINSDASYTPHISSLSKDCFDWLIDWLIDFIAYRYIIKISSVLVSIGVHRCAP